MNLDQLRSFAEVASLGHFTRAAERLHLAQPSLSRQIASLESELRVELFHRARGNIALTAAGERLLPLARRMLADADTARTQMAELAGLTSGRVRLGATPTLCTSLVAEALVSFRARYPGIEVQILERGSRSLIGALASGELDLALIVDTEAAPVGALDMLDRTPLLAESLVVVERRRNAGDLAATASEVSLNDAHLAAESGTLSEASPITLAEVAELPQVMFPENYDLHATLARAFRGAGLTPTTAVTGAEMDASLRFVERGLGVAVVPAMVALERPQLQARPLITPAISRTVSLARRADMNLTHAGAAMQATLRETAHTLTAPGTVTSRFLSRV